MRIPRTSLVQVLTVVLAVGLSASYAHAGCCGESKTRLGSTKPSDSRTWRLCKPCSEPVDACGPVYACKAKFTPTEFKDPKEVWWGHTNRSNANYLAFDKAAIPAPKPAKIAPPPVFEPIYFDLDKDAIRSSEVEKLKHVVKYLKANPKKQATIEGYCCDLATDEYNMALGDRRATAVKKYLVENGIDVGRVTTVSYGESKRATEDPAKREMNRRAEVVVQISGK